MTTSNRLNRLIYDKDAARPASCLKAGEGAGGVLT